MGRFTFNRGTWDNDIPLPASGDNENLDAYLQRVGYASRAAFYGDQHGGQVEIYESLATNSFYACVCPNAALPTKSTVGIDIEAGMSIPRRLF